MPDNNGSSSAIKMTRTPVYIKKSQQYEELRSSAAAFMIIGAGLLILSALCWLNIITLPISYSSRYITQTALTALGILSCMLMLICWRWIFMGGCIRIKVVQERQCLGVGRNS
ncbi:MAG: hypothetical protein ACRDBO_14015 [Lachnospiraceae bacterium]